MNDRNTPNPVPDATPPDAAELVHLCRMVERLLDADLILAQDGEALLEAVAAACRSHGDGDIEAVCRHTARLLRALETLITSRELDAEDGRPALAAARQILRDGAI